MIAHQKCLLWLAGLTAIAAPAPVSASAPAPQLEAGEARAPSPLLQRVAVIGASLSSGSGTQFELGAHASLVPILQSAFTPDAWPADAHPPHDGGMFLMFNNAVMYGSIQAHAAQATDPTLVIALDFLFWYAYGFDMLQDEWRRGQLEEGLAQLDRFDCPILIGDLPDITFALDGKSHWTGGPLIWPSMIPSPEVLAQLNRRIHAWAAERDHVTVAPLADFVAEAYAGPDFEELIQADLLHPKIKGSLTLLLQSLEKLVEARPELDRSHVIWDVQAAKNLVFERTASARASAAARKARVRALLGG